MKEVGTEGKTSRRWFVNSGSYWFDLKRSPGVKEVVTGRFGRTEEMGRKSRSKKERCRFSIGRGRARVGERSRSVASKRKEWSRERRRSRRVVMEVEGNMACSLILKEGTFVSLKIAK